MSKTVLKSLFLAFIVFLGMRPAFSSCVDEAQPGVNWANCDMKGKDLKNKDLSDAVFTGAILDNTDFSNSLLKNADFNFASLQNARFDGARMPNVRMVAIKAQGASFKKSVLTDSRLSR